ncbi:MAG: hypothetical protein LIP03_08270 [Bacteroidales bacterium]|nr:hypothetical protein [Bacteroidales bacterium]
MGKRDWNVVRNWGLRDIKSGWKYALQKRPEFWTGLGAVVLYTAVWVACFLLVAHWSDSFDSAYGGLVILLPIGFLAAYALYWRNKRKKFFDCYFAHAKTDQPKETQIYSPVLDRISDEAETILGEYLGKRLDPFRTGKCRVDFEVTPQELKELLSENLTLRLKPVVIKRSPSYVDYVFTCTDHTGYRRDPLHTKPVFWRTDLCWEVPIIDWWFFKELCAIMKIGNYRWACLSLWSNYPWLDGRTVERIVHCAEKTSDPKWPVDLLRFRSDSEEYVWRLRFRAYDCGVYWPADPHQRRKLLDMDKMACERNYNLKQRNIPYKEPPLKTLKDSRAHKRYRSVWVDIFSSMEIVCFISVFFTFFWAIGHYWDTVSEPNAWPFIVLGVGLSRCSFGR